MVNRLGRKLFVLAGTALFLIPVGVLALNDGTALTPPMGFSTWNYFGCSGINEANVLAVAQSMVQKHVANWEGLQISLLDVGYKSVNLDDCWPPSGYTRPAAPNDTPTWNTSKFPHGMIWLIDSLHRMGLKIGIYSCCGTATCAGYIGSYGHETADANTYVRWGFDYLKEDWCNVPSAYTTGPGAATLYSRMGHALDTAMVHTYPTDSLRKLHKFTFSLCEWGDYNVWTWGDTCGHLWRTTGDISASWSSIYGNWSSSIAHYAYASPGNWNDPDMLEIGNGSLSGTVNQSHMDLWCIAAAPLLMGNNTPAMTAATFTILSNREVIAVDQDSLGYQGRIARTAGNIQVIAKALKVRATDTVNNRKWAVVILNTSTSAAAAGGIKWSDIGETNTKAAYRVRNLWLHRWLQSNNIIDTATPPDTTVTITDSLHVASIPAEGTMHVLMVKGNPDSVGKVTSVLPLDNAAIAAKLCSRMSVRGNEIFIPVARSMVQVFDMVGRQIASVSASQPGWYAVAGRGVVSGTCLVRLTTPAGSVSRVMAFTK